MPLSERSEFFFPFLATKIPKFAKCFGKHLAEIEEVIAPAGRPRRGRRDLESAGD
jgi:hypothetical protein